MIFCLTSNLGRVAFGDIPFPVKNCGNAVIMAAIVGHKTMVLTVIVSSPCPKTNTLNINPVNKAPTGIKVPGILTGESVVYQAVPVNKNIQPVKAIISLIIPVARDEIPQEKKLRYINVCQEKDLGGINSF
jgi:hypothetical protein